MLKDSKLFTGFLIVIACSSLSYLFIQNFEIKLKPNSQVGKFVLSNKPVNKMSDYYNSNEYKNTIKSNVTKVETPTLDLVMAYQRLAETEARNQELKDAKRQREASDLINLGAIIGGWTPAPSSTRSKVTTPSYPTYTSSMTVSSNQLCPMLASPVVKQEVVRGNRICYYQ
jgi:hypothetical protein